LRIAFVRNGDIWVTGHEPATKEKPAPVSPFDWNWKSTRLATPALFDEEAKGRGTGNFFPTHLCWTPNGHYLVYGYQRLASKDESESGIKRYDTQVRLLRIKRNHLKSIAAIDDTFLAKGYDPSVSPDTRSVAFTFNGASHVNEIHMIGIDSHNEQTIIRNGEEPAL
jgi:hypothetical protein